MSAREWSPQQTAIFTWFERTDPADARNLIVRARAGTGKTTTILAAIDRAPERSILLAAFNKRIAQELVTKLHNPNAVAKTLHSVGFEFVRRNWPRVRVDDERKFRLARRSFAEFVQAFREDRRPLNIIEAGAPDQVVGTIAKLASAGKNIMPTVEVSADLIDVANTLGIALENGYAEEYTQEELASMAYHAMHLAAERDGSIDFDDMIYLPVVHRWTRPLFDLTVIDEAQDMNAAQLSLALGVTAKDGRICVVGDDRQAIYGFRGADSNALDNLKRELGAAELPLTVTYRCPKRVVEVAAAIVPDYRAADAAPDGEVLRISTEQMVERVKPADFILSRTNAPLAGLCLHLLRAGKRARIEGRDVSRGLLSLVRRMKASTIPELAAKLDRWAARETEKLVATKRASAQARIEAIADQVQTIEALSDGLADVAELEQRLVELFVDVRDTANDPQPHPFIVLSSVHRAKGLEAETVYVLAETLYCNGKRDTVEERNIHYVAVTRAKGTLVMVSTKAA